MDALEFAKELKRMCDKPRGCEYCPAVKCTCNICNLEEILPIVEKWSAEHPMVTNLDHVAERLEKLGYEVNKEQLRNTCPIQYNCYFGGKQRCPDKECFICRRWWDEEYKEQKNK